MLSQQLKWEHTYSRTTLPELSMMMTYYIPYVSTMVATNTCDLVGT